MNDPKPNAEEVSNAAEISAASAKRPFNPEGGEDEGGAPEDSDDSGMRDDQKPITGNSAGANGSSGDDRHKTEKLTKAGRDIDPDDGSE